MVIASRLGYLTVGEFIDPRDWDLRVPIPGRGARMAKREATSEDDTVVVYLDTFFDRQRAYMFSANPLGIQTDGITAEGQEDDLFFDTLWHSEGRLTKPQMNT